LAAQIIGSSDKCVLDKIVAYKEGLKIKVEEGANEMKNRKTEK
jgi:5-(carboxyamino)imidazole ribonucleotide mutase